MRAYARLTVRLEAFGPLRTRRAGRALAYCPAHNDRVPTLVVTAREDRVLHCRGGCSPRAVVSALELQMSDLFDQPR
jgi:hypothetical protein